MKCRGGGIEGVATSNAAAVSETENGEQERVEASLRADTMVSGCRSSRQQKYFANTASAEAAESHSHDRWLFISLFLPACVISFCASCVCSQIRCY